MFKDGKLFGKINLFDFAIVILVIILIIAGATKFKTFDKTVDASAMGKIQYTFLIKDVRSYTADALESGDAVFDSATNINIGTITNVKKEPAKVTKSLADGSTKIFENEYKNDVILTIETPGTMSNTGYFANKSIELKVGSEKEIETLYMTSLGRVASISYIESEEN